MEKISWRGAHFSERNLRPASSSIFIEIEPVRAACERRERRRIRDGQGCCVGAAGEPEAHPGQLGNYVTWALVMKVHLQARGLWGAIDDARAPADPRTDRLALAAIHGAITGRDLKIARTTATARGAWQALRTLHLGTAPEMRAKARALARDLAAARMRPAEDVGDFYLRLTALVAEIHARGGEVEEGRVAERLLRGASRKFDPLVITIEALCDWKAMADEDLLDRLKAYEIRLELEDRDLRTAEEWEAEMKRRDLRTAEEWEAEMKRRGGGRGRGGDGERGDDSGKKGRRRRFDKSKVRCYNCQDYGHFASECRKPRK